MPDVHLPHLEDEAQAAAKPIPPAAETEHQRQPADKSTLRSKSLLKIGLEVLLIATGVFLGLVGEQWREHAQHREVAEASLRRFRAEIQTNRKAVASVKDYHATTQKSLETYLTADAKTRQAGGVRLNGLQPAFFEHSAWDLALVTQSLAYIDPQLAFALARIYDSQQGYGDLTRGIVQAMYLRPPSENLEGFFRAVVIYYGDVVVMEPALLHMYDEVLPQIDRALGPSPPEKNAVK